MKRSIAIIGAIAALGGTAVLVTGLPQTGATPGSSPAGAGASDLHPSGLPPLVADPRPWDTVEWRPVETSGLDLQPGQYVSRLMRVPGGLVALGQGPFDAPNPDGLTSTLTVWVSADGASWRATPMLAGVEPGNVTEGYSLAAGSRGVVVAGSTCCRQEGTAVWFSADGAGWQRAAFPRLRNSWLSAAAAGEDGFAIVGTVDGSAGIWVSPDGLNWAAVDPAAAGLANGELSHVVALSDGFLAAGMDDARGIDSQAALWRSTGLDAWRRVAAVDPALAGPDEASLSELVPYAGGIFASGGSGSQEERVRCERLLGGEILTAGPATGLSCGWLREMTWHSPDGEAWERIDPWGEDGTYPPEPVGPERRAQVTWDDIVAGGPGLVGLQVELVDGEPGEVADIVGVWTSADGRHWARVGDAPAVGETFVDVVAIDRTVYAITEMGRVWLGTVRP